MSAEIEKVKDETEVAKLDNFTTATDVMGLAKIMIESKLIPSSFKTPEQVIAAVLQGRELGLGAVTSLNNINVIQGRPTLSIHAIVAKLQSKGILTKTIEDKVAVLDAEKKLVDYRTTIRAYIPLQIPINGNNYLEEDSTFLFSEARAMGLDQKDNWKRMLRIMMWTRCMAILARRVAADAILGMYEVSEWSDVVNKEYTVTEEGVVTVLN